MKKVIKWVLLGVLMYVIYFFVPKNTVYEICLEDDIKLMYYVVRDGLFGGHYIIEEDISFFSSLPKNKLKIHLSRTGFSEPYFQMILVCSKNEIDVYSSNYVESLGESVRINIVNGYSWDEWEDLYSRRYLQNHVFIEKDKVHCFYH